MNRLILLLLLLLPLTADAQSKRCETFVGGQGLVYFFKPQKLEAAEGKDVLSFDMTTGVNTDSLVLNFTVAASQPISAALLSLRGAKTVSPEVVRMLYIERTKKGYASRFTCTLPLGQVEELFADASQPVAFEVQCNGTVSAYGYPARKWRKESAEISEIFQIMNLQRQ